MYHLIKWKKVCKDRITILTFNSSSSYKLLLKIRYPTKDDMG